MDATMFYFLITLLACAFVYIVILYKNGKKAEIFRIVEALVYEAEVKFGSGTGELKYQYVVESIYKFLPSYIKLFVSEKLLDVWIELAVDELQEILKKEIEKSHS